MSHQVTVAGFKSHLAAYLQKVQDGEDVLITRHGRPIALLTRPPASGSGPKLGTLAGKIHYSPGWNDPMTDEELESCGPP